MAKQWNGNEAQCQMRLCTARLLCTLQIAFTPRKVSCVHRASLCISVTIDLLTSPRSSKKYHKLLYSKKELMKDNSVHEMLLAVS